MVKLREFINKILQFFRIKEDPGVTFTTDEPEVIWETDPNDPEPLYRLFDHPEEPQECKRVRNKLNDDPGYQRARRKLTEENRKYIRIRNRYHSTKRKRTKKKLSNRSLRQACVFNRRYRVVEKMEREAWENGREIENPVFSRYGGI